MFRKSGMIRETGNLVEKIGTLFTSDHERLTHEEVMERIKQKPDEWAHELNVLNAQHGSLFVSGWRPGLGWICVIAAFLFFVPQYASGAALWVYQCYEAISTQGVSASLPEYPVSDGGLWQLVTLLLGGGALRSIDKFNGVARSK